MGVGLCASSYRGRPLVAWFAEPKLAAAPAFAQVGFGAAAFTRFASEGWWARQDSNLQPDRYERSALTS